MSLVAVKYLARPMATGVLVEYRIPLAPTTLTGAQVSRLNDACAAARVLLETERDRLVHEVRARGVCPWGCGEPPHVPEDTCLVPGGRAS